MSFNSKSEVIGQCAMNGVVHAGQAMVDLMVVHVMLTVGVTNFHHQVILLLLPPVPFWPLLGVAVLHHQNAPPTRWCILVGQMWRHLAHHYWG